MLKPQGYATIVDPEKPIQECDTITCTHCSAIVFIKPKEDASDIGGFCLRCMKHICGPCADLGRCTPFEKKIEQIEAKDRMLRSILG